MTQTPAAAGGRPDPAVTRTCDPIAAAAAAVMTLPVTSAVYGHPLEQGVAMSIVIGPGVSTYRQLTSQGLCGSVPIDS